MYYNHMKQNHNGFQISVSKLMFGVKHFSNLLQRHEGQTHEAGEVVPLGRLRWGRVAGAWRHDIAGYHLQPMEQFNGCARKKNICILCIYQIYIYIRDSIYLSV